jgi:hypothetical protein
VARLPIHLPKVLQHQFGVGKSLGDPKKSVNNHFLFIDLKRPCRRGLPQEDNDSERYAADGEPSDELHQTSACLRTGCPQTLQEVQPVHPERDERGQNVWRLRARGMTRSQIAQALGTSTKSIGRALKTIQRQHASPLALEEQRGLVSEMMRTFRALETEAWETYQRADGAGDRLSILKALSRLVTSHAQMLLRLGIIGPEKPPDASAAPVPPSPNWSPETRLRVAEALLQQRLSVLAEPSPEDEPPSVRSNSNTT